MMDEKNPRRSFCIVECRATIPRFARAREEERDSSSHLARGCRRWSRMTSDVHMGGGRVDVGLRADGDVEAFIEDDLRIAVLDLRYLFTLFLRRHCGRVGARRTERNGEGRGTGRAGSVISESTLAAATTDHTHRRVAKREKQRKIARSRRDRQREGEIVRKNRSGKRKEREETMYRISRGKRKEQTIFSRLLCSPVESCSFLSFYIQYCPEHDDLLE